MAVVFNNQILVSVVLLSVTLYSEEILEMSLLHETCKIGHYEGGCYTTLFKTVSCPDSKLLMPIQSGAGDEQQKSPLS